jgi:hypothetical protein
MGVPEKIMTMMTGAGPVLAGVHVDYSDNHLLFESVDLSSIN